MIILQMFHKKINSQRVQRAEKEKNGSIHFLKTAAVYIGILAIALILELCIFNLNSIRTLGKEPVDITSNIVISEEAVLDADTGIYTVDAEEVTFFAGGLDQDIANLYLGIDFSEEVVPYDIFLTDNGHSQVYQMAQQVLLSDLSDSRYMTIHPYGNVYTLKIVFHVTEGSTFQVRNLSVNMPRPFHLRMTRIFVMFLIMSLFALIRENSVLHSIIFDKNSRKQLIFGLLCMTIALGFTYQVNQSNIETWKSGYVINQYHDLTHALSEGHFNLDYPVSEELLALTNPYDFDARAAGGVSYSYDTAYYNGQYFCYFGITPVLLLYLPIYMLTGQMIQNWQVNLIFALLMVSGCFLLVRELMCRWFSKAPAFLWPVLSVIMAFSGNFFYLYLRPDYYNIPIIAAGVFTVWGLTLWLRGIRSESVRAKVIFYCIGSLSMALVAGCRPQAALFSFLAVPLFWEEVIQKRELFSKKSIGRTIAICIPYIAIAAFLMYYNFERFGSPFEFGAQYNLTVNDMTRQKFDLDRLGGGLFAFLIQPPILMGTFPFIQGSLISSQYMGKMTIEFVLGGIIASNLISVFVVSGVWGTKILKKYKVTMLFVMSVVLMILLACIDAALGGIIQRYTADFVLALLLPGCMIAGIYIEYSKGKSQTLYLGLTKLLMSIALLTVVYDFCILHAHVGDYNIFTQLPEKYYYVRSFFVL